MSNTNNTVLARIELTANRLRELRLILRVLLLILILDVTDSQEKWSIPHNVLRLVSNYITQLLPSIDLTHVCTARDEDVVRNIFEDIESIFNCTQYNFEREQTLDFTYSFDEEAEEAELESDDNKDESCTEDTNDDEENNLLHEFSLQYMKKIVDFLRYNQF